MGECVIEVLPKALCDQLAAGEVLERASSAVKELVENALDAGADEIFIELEEAGRKRLSVSDNGCGMSQEDAKLCILRHATSKIRRTSDLSSISTMGFRGEALASMAAVARLSITTQRHGDETGTYLHVEDAEILECRETATAPGTQVVIEDLFYNTPARLKFLKSPATEQRRVYEVVEAFALSCHEVHWKLSFDGKVKCDYPRHISLKERALAIFGRQLYEHLYPVETTRLGNIMVEGLFCSPEYSQSSSGRLYTYVNRRIIRDKTINSAVSQAYKEFLHGRQPCVVLFITLPLEMVDVNAHPTKLEVRFQNPDEVFRAVYRAVRSSLEKTPWIHSAAEMSRVQLPESAFRSPEENAMRSYGVYGGDMGERERYREDAAHEAIFGKGDALGGVLSVFGKDMGGEGDVVKAADVDRTVLRLEAPRDVERLAQQKELSFGGCEKFGYFSQLTYIGQHALTYLVCSDGNDLVIIDQHAAHERINFERLKRVAEDVLPMASQALLFPLLLPLDARLSQILEEHLSFFEHLGFQIDALGGNTHAVRAVPEVLAGYDYPAMIRDALVDLGEAGRAVQFEDIRDHIIATMACHKSIRAGQRLSQDEVKNLLREMDETGFRSNCPHGRPVHFVISLSELEKRFLRI